MNKFCIWLREGVELVLVNLDEIPKSFKEFTSGFPFIHTTDFQKCDSPIVQDYHVHSLPAMVLLKSELETLLHQTPFDIWMRGWIGFW